MRATARIAEIERELIALGNCLGSIAMLKRLCRTNKAQLELDRKESETRRRIRRAQREIAALEDAYFSEVMRARRDARYPKLQLKRTKMEIL